MWEHLQQLSPASYVSRAGFILALVRQFPGIFTRDDSFRSVLSTAILTLLSIKRNVYQTFGSGPHIFEDQTRRVGQNFELQDAEEAFAEFGIDVTEEMVKEKLHLCDVRAVGIAEFMQVKWPDTFEAILRGAFKPMILSPGFGKSVVALAKRYKFLKADLKATLEKCSLDIDKLPEMQAFASPFGTNESSSVTPEISFEAYEGDFEDVQIIKSQGSSQPSQGAELAFMSVSLLLPLWRPGF